MKPDKVYLCEKILKKLDKLLAEVKIDHQTDILKKNTFTRNKLKIISRLPSSLPTAYIGIVKPLSHFSLLKEE